MILSIDPYNNDPLSFTNSILESLNQLPNQCNSCIGHNLLG